MACFKDSKSVSFRNFIKEHAKDRIHLVGIFVAILELCRRKYLRLEQNRDFADINLVPFEYKK